MKSIRPVAQRMLIGLMAMVQLLFFPVVAFAETPSAALNALQKKEHAHTGPTSPPGADSNSYTFNGKTGLWENEQYTWDPATKQTRPKEKLAYSYNPETGKWDTTDWRYDAPSQKYVAQEPPQEQDGHPQPDRQDSDTPKNRRDPAAKGSFDLFYDAEISNSITSTARSGDATVRTNTTAGSATSGNATAIANVLTMLQSSWGLGPQDINSFSADINGDVVGDLLLDPATLQEKKLTVGDSRPADELVVRDASSIENTITVEARSGDATIRDNTTAGDATSGDATALANVLNLISSSITAGESFIGNINIQGNLEGDILLPDSIKSQLLAANTPTVQLDNAKIENKEALREFTNTDNIDNAITLDARSGDATVRGNTTAGTAVSGASDTKLTLFNLTGKQIIGANALLVFVNVLGEWVGMIVDAPAGTTAGIVGDSTATSRALPANIDADSLHAIDNNIEVAARSGDATIRDNTSAGDARSGKTKAGANVLNLSHSQFSLANWFGVLFINVLGKWHGSFGIDTPAGTIPVAIPAPNSSTTPAAGVRAFRIAGDQESQRLIPANLDAQYTSVLANTTEQPSPNGAAQVLPPTPDTGVSFGPKETSQSTAGLNYWPAAIAAGAAASILVVERLIAVRNAHLREVHSRGKSHTNRRAT